MRKYKGKKDNKEYILKIVRDEKPMDPRNWEQLGIMVCFHEKYNLGNDHNIDSSNFNSWEDIKLYLRKRERVIEILPLYLYDHSGITISTGRVEKRAWGKGDLREGKTSLFFVSFLDVDCYPSSLGINCYPFYTFVKIGFFTLFGN